MGLPPSPSHSIDRKDNDGNYSCGRCKQCRRNGWTMNCRWATWRQQQNNRRSNVYVTIDGRRRTLSQWTRFLGLKRGTVLSRVHRGLEYRDALLLPVDKRMSRTNGGPKRRSL
jgi:hypothetical protein